MRLSICFTFLKSALMRLYRPAGAQVLHHTWIRPSSTMTSTVSPVLSVFPKRGLLDEKFKLVVENLPPGLPVTLHSLHHTDDKDTLEAYGHYISDDRGTVTVSDDVSIGGTYTGKEPMGLLWSMHPVPGSRPGISWRKKDVHTPMVVFISVYRGHVVEGFNEQPPMASVVTERWYMAPGVQRIDIEERGVRGTLFLPPGPGPFPGLLNVLGARALTQGRGALLASHGFASLVVDYVTPDKTWKADLGLDYFETAFNILQEHPLVINDRVGVFSFSFGVLLTFSMAAYSKIATPRCCVCVNGTHVPRFNKSTSDAFAHINKDMDKIPLNEENQTALRFPAYGIPTDPMKKVEMGRITCPMLFVIGEDDQCFASMKLAEDITKMMRAAGNEHLVNTLTYPNAGHLIEPPYKPHCRASDYIQWNTSTTVSDDVSIGGTYTGKELMGLLWSMHPVPGSRPGISWRKKDVHTPMVLFISVYRGHVVEGFNEQPPMASVVTERWYMAPGVQRIDIEERGVRGTLFLPPGPGPFPGLLNVLGARALTQGRGALLASHGFASLVVDYVTPDKTWKADLGLDYFETAFNILQEHPLVINDRVGVFSFSFGVLLTFSMAAYSKIATPRCCVCVNGTHVPRFNKSTSDALAHINKDMDKIPLNEENHTALRFPAYGIPTDPMKKVEMGRITCPMLFIIGEDDQCFASMKLAEDITKMMRAAGNEHLLNTLTYPNAGHLIEPPYKPHCRASDYIQWNTSTTERTTRTRNLNSDWNQERAVPVREHKYCITPGSVLSVFPKRGLLDEKFKLVVENLPPGLPVTLHSLHHTDDKDTLEAYGHYISDDRGTVTVSDDVSIGGTYTGKEPMGLLWSMHPVPGSRPGISWRKKDVHTPMVVFISVYRGHVVEGFNEQPPMASVVTERWYMAPGVQRIDIEEGGVRGTLFLPPGPGPFPGLLNVLGARALTQGRGALLASHGFASLVVDYVTPDKTWKADLGLDYFETAFNILQEHPLVINDRVGVFSFSFGVLLTFSMAAYSKIATPRCCVCVNGTHVPRFNKSTSDAFAHINKDMDTIPLNEENQTALRFPAYGIPTDPMKKVEMGRITCPMLFVIGEDDQCFASMKLAEDITKMMRAAGNEHLVNTLTYPNAGHLIEPPYKPHCRASDYIQWNTSTTVFMLWGGQAKPHADAEEDSWMKILAFLRQHLQPGPDVIPPDNKL